MATVGASAVPAGSSDKLTGVRLIAGYVAVTGFLVAAIATSIGIGATRHAAPGIAGFYSSSSACLGKDFKIVQSGEFLDVSGGASGKLRLRHNHLTGKLTCAGGGAAAATDLVLTGKGATAKLAGTVGAAQVSAKLRIGKTFPLAEAAEAHR